MRPSGTALVLALALAGAAAHAQEEYSPLFSEETIRQASPQQQARMRELEKQNRRSFEQRQQGKQSQAEGEQGDAQEAAAPAAPAAPPRSKTRIFKWVDDKGRVHFGDAPEGAGAQEVKVRGVARPPPSPPPPPGETAKTN